MFAPFPDCYQTGRALSHERIGAGQRSLTGQMAPAAAGKNVE